MEKDFNLMVGLRIREVREASNLTREEFCEYCDLSPSFLADVERGKKGISAASLYRICKFTNMSADYVLFGNGKGFDTDVLIEMVKSVQEPYKEPMKDIISAYMKAIEINEDTKKKNRVEGG